MTEEKTDKEKAEEYRKNLNALLIPICAVMTKAKQQDGLEINFNINTHEVSGLVEVTKITISKKLEL